MVAESSDFKLNPSIEFIFPSVGQGVVSPEARPTRLDKTRLGGASGADSNL